MSSGPHHSSITIQEPWEMLFPGPQPEVQVRHSTTFSEKRKKNNSVSSLLKDFLSLIW